MKPEEALMELELEGGIEITGRPKRLAGFIEALDVAIEALKEVQQYREIGTVEECREAMEKQESKKPQYYGDSEDGRILCPTCKENLWDLKECGFNTCPYCGQKLDWSEK